MKIYYENLPCKFNLLFFFSYFFIKSGLTQEQVSSFLIENPDFLERHIMKEVELEQLERWMIRRTQQAKKSAQSQFPAIGKNGRKTSLSRYDDCAYRAN